MFFGIKNWFSHSDKARRQALADSVTILNSKKRSAQEKYRDQSKYFLTLDGVEAFLAADGMGPRETVLKEHPFWQRENPMAGLDASTCIKVLHHILDIHEQYMMALRYGNPAYSYDHEGSPEEEREKILNMQGIAWGMPEEYTKWQEQAAVLAQQEPLYAADLLNAVAMQLRFSSSDSDNNKNWAMQAEHLLANGGLLAAADVFTGLVQSVKASEMRTVLTKAPHLAAFLDSPQYDQEAIAWGGQHEAYLHWLAKNHPRLSSWDIAEVIDDPDLIKSLAETSRDGAVLKAWHGIALTSEEVSSHPLAYSLYVNKHAPIYMEEAQQLPDVWSMALSLCTTGVDFKNMLLMAAKNKMSPPTQVDELSLPDLGATP